MCVSFPKMQICELKFGGTIPSWYNSELPTFLLKCDLYITVLCNGIVHKLYCDDYSDDNNEYEIMQLLYGYGIIPIKPLYSRKVNYEITLFSGETRQIYKEIAYPHIPGIKIGQITDVTDEEWSRWKNQVSKQLTDLHNIGIIYGDQFNNNIIITHDRSHAMIDNFCRSFSLVDPSLPPMDYMLEDKEIPDEAEDWYYLNRFFDG
jgi:hypothetical protein